MKSQEFFSNNLISTSPTVTVPFQYSSLTSSFFFAMSPFRDIALYAFDFSQSADAICSDCYNQHDDSVTPQCPGAETLRERKEPAS